MKIEPPYYPIIYIRGFAATMTEIEETNATPYMGFNKGSTKVRQDHNGDILRFIFESPLIRFLKDEGYKDAYTDGDLIDDENDISAKSIWIFRYYEQVSEDLGTGERKEILQFAADLRDFIVNTVKKKVCKSDQTLHEDFKVNLVAHSMGGLIARCYLQNICVNGVENGKYLGYSNSKLELAGDFNRTFVDKVFTYGTPHNGIDFKGINVPNIGNLDPLHIRNFNRKLMREYLDIPDNHPVNSLNNTFPEERFFNFVGSNYKDYNAFFGVSRQATGEMSDGLVMIKNATVKGAPRAFAHRAHSGHYGLVNSEEGYQNLRRFLFGQSKVDAFLEFKKLTLPKKVQELKDEGKEIKASYYIETTAQVRKSKIFLHERKVDHESAILADYDDIIKKNKKIYLFSGFLHRAARAKKVKDRSLAFAIWIGIQVPLYEVDKRFWFDGFFPGGYIFNDSIYFHYYPDRKKLSYGLGSVQGAGNTKSTSSTDLSIIEEGLKITIPLGFKSDIKHPPKPGFSGDLILNIQRWN